MIANLPVVAIIFCRIGFDQKKMYWLVLGYVSGLNAYGVTIIINGHIIAPLFNAEAATHI